MNESQSIKKTQTISNLPCLTTNFTPVNRYSLRINFDNATGPDYLFDLVEDIKEHENLLIKGLNRSELRLIDERLDISDTLNKDERSIALYLNKVILHDPLKINIRESFTNNFVNYLLNKLEFNRYPLILNAQPKYCFEVQAIKVTGRPEFSAEKNEELKVLFLDESRHLTNLKLATEFAECQIAGEILCAAYTNYAYPLSPTVLKDQVIYAVRIIGTRFTFYKANVSKTYLYALADGNLEPDNNVTIFRYPSNENKETLYGYDYSNNLHRIIILKLLVSLREFINKD